MRLRPWLFTGLLLLASPALAGSEFVTNFPSPSQQDDAWDSGNRYVIVPASGKRLILLDAIRGASWYLEVEEKDPKWRIVPLERAPEPLSPQPALPDGRSKNNDKGQPH
ncbi:MAG: hypothetical protein HQL51_15070 [Magnetococcales bacterium]|nr:hypothetical protein [Magnetococcales bacterium]